MDSGSSSSDSSFYQEEYWRLKAQYEKILESNSQMVLRLEESKLTLCRTTKELQNQNSILMSETIKLRARKDYLQQELGKLNGVVNDLKKEMETQERSLESQKGCLSVLMNKIDLVVKNKDVFVSKVHEVNVEENFDGFEKHSVEQALEKQSRASNTEAFLPGIAEEQSSDEDSCGKLEISDVSETQEFIATSKSVVPVKQWNINWKQERGSLFSISSETIDRPFLYNHVSKKEEQQSYLNLKKDLHKSGQHVEERRKTFVTVEHINAIQQQSNPTFEKEPNESNQIGLRSDNPQSILKNFKLANDHGKTANQEKERDRSSRKVITSNQSTSTMDRYGGDKNNDQGLSKNINEMDNLHNPNSQTYPTINANYTTIHKTIYNHTATKLLNNKDEQDSQEERPPNIIAALPYEAKIIAKDVVWSNVATSGFRDDRDGLETNSILTQESQSPSHVNLSTKEQCCITTSNPMGIQQPFISTSMDTSQYQATRVEGDFQQLGRLLIRKSSKTTGPVAPARFLPPLQENIFPVENTPANVCHLPLKIESPMQAKHAKNCKNTNDTTYTVHETVCNGDLVMPTSQTLRETPLAEVLGTPEDCRMSQDYCDVSTSSTRRPSTACRKRGNRELEMLRRDATAVTNVSLEYQGRVTRARSKPRRHEKENTNDLSVSAYDSSTEFETKTKFGRPSRKPKH